MIRVLAALAVAGAMLPAQVRIERPVRAPHRATRETRPQTTPPAAFDVHVLKLTTSAPGLVPTTEIVAAKRLMVDPKAGERSLRVQVGGARFSLEIHDDGAGGVFVDRQAGNNSSMGQPPARTVDVPDPWRWGRRPRHGNVVRGAMLCEPVSDATKPFEPLDARGFIQHLVEPLLAADARPGEGEEFTQWMSPRWMAACVLGSVPLREYLDPDQVDRILAKGAKVPADDWDRFWPLLRPLVALGHKPMLDRLAGREEMHGPDGESDDGGIRTPSIPRSVEDSVLIAYATARDPALRGLAGWIATATRSTDVYDQLLEDVQSGRAVLPGDALHREALASHLVHARAWQSTAAPTVTLAASGLAIAAAMILLRLAMRRLL